MAKKDVLEKYNSKKRGWLHDAIFFVAALVIVIIVFRYFVGVSFVSGDSMEFNLKDGDCVIYLRQATDFERGDIVSVWVPSGNYYIKRVVAVAGDVIDIHDGDIYVNDEKMNEAYVTGQTNKQLRAVLYPYTVREGNVFVLGDNREKSMDSRTFGEVSGIQIRGKIVYKISLSGIEKM